MKITKTCFNEKPLGKESFAATPCGPKEEGRCGAVNRLSLSPALLATSDLNHLFRAAYECKRNVAWKDSVIGFMTNLIPNIVKIRSELIEGDYRLKPYKCFVIHEPKTREIVATSHRDRVVQRAFCNAYFYEAITRHFIYDNCANQKGKGTDFARKRLKAQIHRWWKRHGREGWVVEFDIKSFLRKFESRLHEEGHLRNDGRSICNSVREYDCGLLWGSRPWSWFGNEPAACLGESKRHGPLHQREAPCRGVCEIHGRWQGHLQNKGRGAERVVQDFGGIGEARPKGIQEENEDFSVKPADQVPWVEVHPPAGRRNRPKAGERQDKASAEQAQKDVRRWRANKEHPTCPGMYVVIADAWQHVSRQATAHRLLQGGIYR